MLGYLSEVRDRLKLLKAGMKKNTAVWTNQSVKPEDVETAIEGIETKDAEVEAVKQEQTLKLSQARELSATSTKLADKIENLALGLHGDVTEKLIEYGIKQRKTAAPKPTPTKLLIPTLEDDTDGEGFIVNTQKDPDADYYEWQKGIGTNAADPKAIPEMKNFKTTKKTSFVDDEVPKGSRIFYRVRAANTNGNGAWSEAVSRVQ
ncbi:MAG: hypothetical protein FD122_2959 [Stygiobacter sp.]|nr:MAG: hypothetical protein FD122_2959 [Stygiobacter sp.]KAF0212023.1 MAG: hypothetical protein FD178_3303 [Ignavibacteria bacterium]